MRGKHRKHREFGDARGVFAPSVGEIERLARRRRHASRSTRLQSARDGYGRTCHRPSPTVPPPGPGPAWRIPPRPDRAGTGTGDGRWFLSRLCTVGDRCRPESPQRGVPPPTPPSPSPTRFVHVTVTGSDRGRKPGIELHRASELPPDEITYRHRIPVTTPARTMLDLAADLDSSTLEGALARAHHRRLATPRAIQTLVARYPRRPGTPRSRPSSTVRGLPGSRVRIRSAGSSRRSAARSYRSPKRMRRWRATRSTSSGRRSEWSSRSMATRFTQPAPIANATSHAMLASQSSGTRFCGSTRTSASSGPWR